MTIPALPPEDEAPKAGKPIVPVIIGLVALLAGVGVGAKVVGPKMKGGPAPKEASAAGGHGGDAEGGAEGESKIYMVNNLIVSPAGSLGSRMLIMSVAFEVPDAESQAKLQRAEAPLRDAITSILERETLESLGRPGAREAFKPRLGAIAATFIPGIKITVYIPQFLVQ